MTRWLEQETFQKNYQLPEKTVLQMHLQHDMSLTQKLNLAALKKLLSLQTLF
jgi:hypothetical protein